MTTVGISSALCITDREHYTAVNAVAKPTPIFGRELLGRILAYIALRHRRLPAARRPEQTVGGA